MNDSAFKATLTLLMVIFSVACFAAGYTFGSGFSNIESELKLMAAKSEIRQSAIDAGVGEYNATTGAFQWKAIKSATSSH